MFSASKRIDSVWTTVLLMGCLGAVFLAGGDLRQIGLGTFLVIAGGIMLLIRPTASVPWIFWILGVGITLCSCLPLLTPALPETLPLLNGIIPGHEGIWPRSVEPATTVFWALILGGSVLLALYLLSSPLTPDRLRRVARLMVLSCLVYGGVSLMLWKSPMIVPEWLKLAGPDAVFGLFPNRNHTAGFLLTGAILSVGLLLDSSARGRGWDLLVSAISLPVLIAFLLACSKSRSGLVFLVVGLAIWFIGLGKRRPKWLLMAVVIFGVVVVAVFATSGAPLLKRFLSSDQSETGAGPRLEIAKDTLGMISSSPIIGHGMGTYPLLYPQHARESLRWATTAMHPESDWLLLLHDSGIFSGILTLVALALIFLRIPGDADSREDWPLRWGLASAFLAEIFHSFVDVPLHRVELGWWILIAGGVSVSGWMASGQRIVWQGIIFRISGILLLLLGIWMIGSRISGIPQPPPFESFQARERVLKLYGAVPYGAAAPVLAECERLLAKYPFNTDLAHQYATFLIQEKTDPERSRTLFSLERQLLPHDGDIVFQQGWILIDADPAETVSLWREALARQARMDALPGNPIPRLPELFRSMMQVASEHSGLVGRMGEVAYDYPSARLLWISSPLCPVKELESAVRDQAFMAALTPSQRGKVFVLMWERGDRSVLRTLLESAPSAPEGLTIRARFMAEEGRSEEACRLLISRYGIPVHLPDGQSRLIQGGGGDLPKTPLATSRYYAERGNLIAARRYLDDARRSPQDKAEDLSLAGADLALAEGKWSEALQMLLAFLDETGHL